jgi:hypothetical protein
MASLCSVYAADALAIASNEEWSLKVHMRWTPTWSSARALQAALLRELFGNPFRPVAADPSWLTWNDGTIPKLAGAIYDDRAFDRMPVLADALEESGCMNSDILGHCRGPGSHCRGCWVVDLLTGRS